MATSTSPEGDPLLMKVNKKIADLMDVVRRLTDQLRSKEALLTWCFDVAHKQSLRMSSFNAALQDTAPWNPSCPRAVLLLNPQPRAIMG